MQIKISEVFLCDIKQFYRSYTLKWIQIRLITLIRIRILHLITVMHGARCTKMVEKFATGVVDTGGAP
jgi:hypothetical protein